MKQMKKYLAAGLFAVLVILQAVSLYQLNSLKRDNRELQEKAAVAESRYQELEQMQTELQDLATEIKLAERNQSAQDTWVEPENVFCGSTASCIMEPRRQAPWETAQWSGE